MASMDRKNLRLTKSACTCGNIQLRIFNYFDQKAFKKVVLNIFYLIVLFGVLNIDIDGELQ